MTRRLGACTLVVAIIIGVTGGCSHPTTAADLVRAATRRTRQLSRRFVYRSQTADRRVTVEGVVEDDLRFGSTVSIGSRPVLDEVVRDDAVAEHFRDPSAVPLFLRTAPAGQPGSPAATTPVGGTATPAPTPGLPDRDTTLSELAGDRWVLDPGGAPSLVPLPHGQATGLDPVLEAMQVFDYVDTAVGQAASVVRFNPEDVSYNARLDPFPRPGPGVLRYDLNPPPLPRPGATGAVNQVVPDVANFRKMSVYVRSGLVEEVRETIDVRSRLNEFVHLYGAKLPANASRDAQAAFAVEVTNNIRKGEGQEPIVVRSMSLTLTDVGAPLAAPLPADTVPGDLSVLADLGTRVRTSLG